MRALVLLLAMGCTGEEPTDDTGSPEVAWQDWAPEAAGPYNVGHTTLTHTYTAFEGDDPRTITIDVWTVDHAVAIWVSRVVTAFRDVE